MGKQMGIDTILVLTGITKEEEVGRSSIRPDLIVSDLRQLYDSFYSSR